MKKLFYYEREEGVEPELDKQRKQTAITAVGYGITHCLLNTSSLFSSSDYSELPNQRGAIQSAFSMIESSGGQIVSSKTHDCSRLKDFLVVTKAHFDLEKLDHSKVFGTAAPKGKKVVVEASFITGLHPIMFELFEYNCLINEAVEQYTPPENYDPNTVIPQTLSAQNFKQLSVRAMLDQPLADVSWYINDKQQYVGVVINGYEFIPKNPKVVKAKSNLKEIFVTKNKSSVKSS